MSKLILIAVLWFGAISVFAYALFQYLDNRHERNHEQEMTETELSHEERQTLFDDE